MKAFLIARVSTADQVDALPAQVYRLKDYAEKKGYDYTLFEIQESAYQGNREKFRIIVDQIINAKETIVVVFDKIDRFTRDSSAEETAIFKKLLRNGAIELHIPSENLFLNEHSSSSERMRLNMGSMFAENYSDAISENVRRRNEQLWRDGIWTSKAPFGYKNVRLDADKRWIEIVPLQAKAVKTAFELYATGAYSLKLVRQKIIEEYGLVLTSAQWDKVLKNPFYYGVMNIKGKLLAHQYETIIEKRLFYKVEAVRLGYAKNPTRWAGLPYPYRGLIDCSECGCRITFEKKKQKYVYGHCTQYKGKHGASYVSQDTLTKQLQQVFREIHMPQHAYDQVRASLAEDEVQDAKDTNEKLAAITHQITHIDTKLDRNHDTYLDGDISKETYLKKRDELTKTKETLESTRNTIELVLKQDNEEVFDLLEIVREAPKIFKNSENDEKRVLLKKVLSNLELDDKQLRWKLKKPYDVVAYCNKTQNWLGIVDDYRTLIEVDEPGNDVKSATEDNEDV